MRVAVLQEAVGRFAVPGGFPQNGEPAPGTRPRRPEDGGGVYAYFLPAARRAVRLKPTWL